MLQAAARRLVGTSCLQSALACSTATALAHGASCSAGGERSVFQATHGVPSCSAAHAGVLRTAWGAGGFHALHGLHAAGQTRGMFIQTQTTPNPASLMFQPGCTVMESGVQEFSSAREGMKSPLAKRLFAIDGVTGVFFGTEFVTVSKKDSISWAVLKPDIFAAIMDHFSSGDLLMLDNEHLAASDTAIHPDDSEVVAMIKELLETRVRPAVQEDGGDIVYKDFDDMTGVVTVKMVGACSGCPSSSITLKSGIESMLMHYIPEVKGVIQSGDNENGEEGGGEAEKEPVVVEAPAKPINPFEAHLSQ
ncbi:hypothetical protein FOA52_001537 [Chlamydomonas sp. UWO 241]|nr:hypothetical protein FOA52_001537 [Chlamydomonas sp. UWO 241]